MAMSHRLANFSDRDRSRACKFFPGWRIFPLKASKCEPKKALHLKVEVARVLQNTGIDVLP